MPKNKCQLALKTEGGFYACRMCDYKTNSDYAMRLHLRTSHNFLRGAKEQDKSKMGQCGVCGKVSKKKICCIYPRS